MKMETFIKFSSGYEITDKTVNFQVKLIRVNKNNGFFTRWLVVFRFGTDQHIDTISLFVHIWLLTFEEGRILAEVIGKGVRDESILTNPRNSSVKERTPNNLISVRTSI